MSSARAMAARAWWRNTYLEGSYTERYPAIERSRNGLQRLFRQFSWPYGIPSHVSPETPGLHSRRRRAGLFAAPRLWRGVRQSRSDRRLHRRRRRGGNRRAGRQLAFQQVSQPRARRRGAADPASQRLQDRQPDRAGAHQPRGADRPAARLWLRAAFRRGRRSRRWCTNRSPARSIRSWREIREIQSTARAVRPPECPSVRAGR